MCAMDAVYPAYGLASHKGYGTPMHRRALVEHGPTPLHRYSFAPVSTMKKILQQEEAPCLFD